MVCFPSPVSVHPARVMAPWRRHRSHGVSHSLPRVALLCEDTAEHLQRQEPSSRHPNPPECLHLPAAPHLCNVCRHILQICRTFRWCRSHRSRTSLGVSVQPCPSAPWAQRHTAAGTGDNGQRFIFLKIWLKSRVQLIFRYFPCF